MRAALTLAAALAASTAPADPVGLWKTPVDQGVIRIDRCGDDICGRTISSARLRVEPDQTDARNKDPALRGRLIRDIVLFRLKPIGPGRWGRGTIYNPKDGQTYRAELRVEGPDAVRLRGCIIVPLCQTQTWTRAVSPQSPTNR